MSGCSGGCCSSAPICPCRFDQNPEIDSLPLVVACFQHRQAGLHAEQVYYASLPSLDVAVIDAVLVLKEENGLRPDHDPKQLAAEQIDRLEQRLVGALDRIDSCTDFRALYALTAEQFAEESAMASPTAAYDTALRIALFTGNMPDAILVHAGNQAAVSALCGAQGLGAWVPLSQLPAEFGALSVAEAELCLSTCTLKVCGITGNAL